MNDMKKILILLLLCTATTMAFAQKSESGENKIDKIPLYLEYSLGIGTPSNKTTPFLMDINLDYQITKRLSVRGILEKDFMIPKDGGVKDYNSSLNLGGGLGYSLFPVKDDDKDVLEARASFTTSVDGKIYKNNSFDVGLYWYGRNKSRLHWFQPIVGVGYKFMDFREKGLKNYNGAFVTLGIRF